jgi:hypothetical protein
MDADPNDHNEPRLPLRDDCLAASASLVCAMPLLSGLANTQCSVCRFDLSGLDLAQLRLAPGTGLEGPETGSQNPRYRDL